MSDQPSPIEVACEGINLTLATARAIAVGEASELHKLLETDVEDITTGHLQLCRSLLRWVSLQIDTMEDAL